ncbi:MAG: GNAT family N-acetyltransferase [Dehalobacterium sp.]
MTDSILGKSVAYLKTDVRRNLTGLKYISWYKDKLTVNLVEDNQKWALLIEIPSKILSFDTANYPKADKAIFLNGTSEQLKYKLLDTLPQSNYILRLNEDLDLSVLSNRFAINKANSFISLTCSTFNVSAKDNMVTGNTLLTDEAIDMIKRNGYSESEIKNFFNNGSVWFGLTINEKIRSICFIYQNYGDIWEIAGVHTLEKERNKGYAQIVVMSALAYILERNLFPKYEVNVRNTNSIKLARSLNMKEFVRINHFLLSSL